MIKKIIFSLMAICIMLSTQPSFSQTGSKKSSKPHSSGTYKGGKGSSHKGGKYKNKSTNNHYKKRK